MDDIFKRLTDLSDPVITKYSTVNRAKLSRPRKPLSSEIRALLQVPALPIDNLNEEEDNEIVLKTIHINHLLEKMFNNTEFI